MIEHMNVPGNILIGTYSLLDAVGGFWSPSIYAVGVVWVSIKGIQFGVFC